MPNAEKRILWHCASGRGFDRLMVALREAAAGPPLRTIAPSGDVVVHDGLVMRWVEQPTLDTLIAELDQRYVNLVVLDLRCGAEAKRAMFAVLDALDHTEDIEARFAFDRIVVVLPAATSADLDDLVLGLGARGIRHIVRAGEPGDEAVLARALLAEVGPILRSRRRGKSALCASGGGITGIYFELGVLKCLDDCLGAGGVNDFDMYFGISAGAVVTGPLAVGYSVDEHLAAIAGVSGGRLPRVDMGLLRLSHLDARSFAQRALRAARATATALWRAVSRRRPIDNDELLFEFADLVAAPFRADHFERQLRRILTAPGASNDFRRLTKKLFIGATDQDARAHVVFGDEQHDHVPISLAIQASLSLNPAFAATPIDGRFYEDGAVTRTSNFVEAIRRDATLILVIDPLVPYVAREPGFSNRRGILYNLDQNLRAISFTRYEATRNVVLRQHPEVSSYTFVPANRTRRLMSINPMDHRPWREICRGGYLSMFNRLRALEHRLVGDLASHGHVLDLTRAREVAERLEHLERPELRDFFPDREIVIRRQPLCLEAPRSGSPPHRQVA